MPGLKIENGVIADRRWLANTHGIGNCVTKSLKAADFTAHVVNGVIPSGTAVTFEAGSVKPFVSGGKLNGFLFDPVDATIPGEIGVPVLINGTVKIGLLPAATKTLVAEKQPETGTNTDSGIVFVKEGN